MKLSLSAHCYRHITTIILKSNDYDAHYITVTVTTPSVGEPTKLNLAIIVGPAVGGLLFVVIMVTVVACLTCCMIRRNKKIDNQLGKKRQNVEMKIIGTTAAAEKKVDLDSDEQ